MLRNRIDDACRPRTSAQALQVAKLVAFAAFVVGCSEKREVAAPPPTYDGDVAALLAARCSTCHGTAESRGGFRTTSYLETIACLPDGRAPVLPREGGAPLLAVLEDATHSRLLSDGEMRTLKAWVLAGSPKFAGSVHDAAFVDPRSAGSHGRKLRGTRWRAMLDPTDPDACGRCHDGTKSRPEAIALAAPGATACTSCHREPEGVLACGTCHGGGARSYPPRDPCFFPEDVARARGGGSAHARHVEPGALHSDGLPCSTCHPAPGFPVIGGAHGNGVVDVVFDPARAGDASYDRTTAACANACHSRSSAARPRPRWTEGASMQCGDCHGSPPAAHYPGACTSCHAGTDPAGSKLTSATLHMNGRVDLGDGSGRCGACHGTGDDPWPKTNAHRAHAAPKAAAPVSCATCHPVAAGFGPGSGHPRGGEVRVVLEGRARAKGAPASYAAGTCSNVYCHGAKLIGTVPSSPLWSDSSGSASVCGACHGIPPGQPHIASTGCDLAACHGSVVEQTSGGPRISPARALDHVDGTLN